LLTDGNRSTGAPFSRTPAWQADLPTQNRITGDGSGVPEGQEDWEELTIPFSSLLPSFGGAARSRPSEEGRSKYKFDAAEIREMGVMLSLKLADGTPNPKETFGEGTFPFELRIQSIEPVASSTSSSSN